MLIAKGAMQSPDYVILGGYFALMLLIGVFFYGRMKRMKDYFSGGNQIPWWLSGVSYYMSCFSVYAFIAYAALAWEFGWLGVTVFWFMAPATLVSVLFFARRWRRARIDSPVEYLETRYGQGLRQIFAWQNIPVRIIDDAFKLVSIGVFISKGLDMDMREAMLYSGLIMLAYTLLGGLWAVTVTDFIQFIVLAAAVIAVLPLSIHATGGVGPAVQHLSERGFRMTTPEYNWFYIATTVFLFCLSFSSINWALIQRYYCVPREKDAYKVGGLVFVLNIIGPPLILLPVMLATEFLPGVDQPKQVYPMLCRYLLPAGMLGLVIAAMFSATMSMLSSDYNVCAAVLTNDVYRRYLRPAAGERELVQVGRGMTLLVGLISLGVAFSMGDASGEGLFRNMVTLFSVAAPPVAVSMLLGLLTRRVSNEGAIVGFLLGIVTGLALFIWGSDSIDVLGLVVKKENAIVWSTTLVTLGSTLSVSWLAPPSPAQQKRIDGFLYRLTVPIGQHEGDAIPAPGEQRPLSPFRIVGVSTGIIGLMVLGVSIAIKGALALKVNLILGTCLLLTGALLAYAGRRRKQTAEQ